MSDDYTWRRDRDRSRRDDDRDWYRRTEDYRREGTGWGRGRDEREPWRETYGRDATDRDWSTRGRDRASYGSDDWNRDRGRDEWGGRYGREDWGRDYGRDPRYGGMMGPGAAGGVPGGGWGFSEEYGRDPGWDYGMSSGYPRGGYPRGDYGRDRYGYNEHRGYGRSGPQDRGSGTALPTRCRPGSATRTPNAAAAKMPGATCTVVVDRAATLGPTTASART